VQRIKVLPLPEMETLSGYEIHYRPTYYIKAEPNDPMLDIVPVLEKTVASAGSLFAVTIDPDAAMDDPERITLIYRQEAIAGIVLNTHQVLGHAVSVIDKAVREMNGDTGNGH